LFAKVQSQKDSNISHVVWNPGSEFAFCNCAWSLRGNLCKHIMKVNMMCENRLGHKSSMSYHSFSELLTALWRKPLDDSIELDKAMALTRQILDQVQRLLELTSAKDICTVVDNLPLKWASRKARTAPRKPLTALALASTSRNERNNCSARKYYRKRRRLSRLR